MIAPKLLSFYLYISKRTYHHHLTFSFSVGNSFFHNSIYLRLFQYLTTQSKVFSVTCTGMEAFFLLIYLSRCKVPLLLTLYLVPLYLQLPGGVFSNVDLIASSILLFAPSLPRESH